MDGWASKTATELHWQTKLLCRKVDSIYYLLENCSRSLLGEEREAKQSGIDNIYLLPFTLSTLDSAWPLLQATFIRSHSIKILKVLCLFEVYRIKASKSIIEVEIFGRWELRFYAPSKLRQWNRHQKLRRAFPFKRLWN